VLGAEPAISKQSLSGVCFLTSAAAPREPLVLGSGACHCEQGLPPCLRPVLSQEDLQRHCPEGKPVTPIPPHHAELGIAVLTSLSKKFLLFTAIHVLSESLKEATAVSS